MAKAFLASVGNGILMGRVDGELQMMAHVNTLTESTLSITSTQEEVRAGQGAKLYGRFNHDAGLTVTLTDAMFDLNYIAWQVGSELKRGGIVMQTEQVTATSEDWDGTPKPTLRVSKPIQKMGESCGFDNYLVWYREAGCAASDDYHSATPVTEGGFVVQAEDIEVGKEYCVSYFTDELSAKTVLVNANFVPAELVLILTTKLFAGDANNVETGRPVGEITIKIPRFSLDGAFDLSMAMSSAATMSLNGTALATASSDCDGDGVYAEIVEVRNGVKWYDGLLTLEPDLGDVDGQKVATPENTYEVLVDSITPNATTIDTFATFKNNTPQIVPTYYIAAQLSGSATIAFDKYTGMITAAPTAGDTVTVNLNTEIADNANVVADLGENPSYTIKFVEEFTE